MTSFHEHARTLEVRRVLLQGVVSGLAIAQMTAWQDAIDACLRPLLGESSDEPHSMVVRAVATSAFTVLTCFLLLKGCVRLEACYRPAGGDAAA